MHAILHWVVYDSTAVMQCALLAAFLLVSMSPEHRKTGVILTPFAVFYFILVPLNGFMNDFSPSMYALLYGMMDYLAAYLVSKHGGKGSKSQATILSLFVLSHIMAWGYASGYISPLDPLRYGVLNFALIVLQILFSIPGIRRGLDELHVMAGKFYDENIKTLGLHPGLDSNSDAFGSRICDSPVSDERRDVDFDQEHSYVERKDFKNSGKQ